jgi:hypothetical protein
MTDLSIRPEAIEAAGDAYYYRSSDIPPIERAIVAFCEAEGLTVEYQRVLARAPMTGEAMAIGACAADKAEQQRLVGLWREVSDA